MSDYNPPLMSRWVPGTLPKDDQCDECGDIALGYWVSIDPKTGRRIIVACCETHRSKEAGIFGGLLGWALHCALGWEHEDEDRERRNDEPEQDNISNR